MANLVIDTDMGYDDMLALALLVNKPNTTIRGISVIAGVASQNKGLINLNRLLKWMKQSGLPVYRGARSYRQPTSVAFPAADRTRADNLSLLEKIPLPQSRFAPVKPWKSLANTIAASKKPFTLLCLGPLSTIANLIDKPRTRANIKQIVIMGGAVFVPGNVPPEKLREYNLALDPQSAQTVFRSGLPITLIATDTTRNAPARLSTAGDKSAELATFLNQLNSLKPKTPIGQLLATIIQNNQADLDYFYDPVAAAIITNPPLIQEQIKLDINVTPSGQTIGTVNPLGLVSLITKIDTAGFYQILLDTVGGTDI